MPIKPIKPIIPITIEVYKQKKEDPRHHSMLGASR